MLVHVNLDHVVVDLFYHLSLSSLQRDLVEETISYIAYLEGILQMANEKVRIFVNILIPKKSTGLQIQWLQQFIHARSFAKVIVVVS